MSEKIKSFIIKTFTGTVLPFKLVDLKTQKTLKQAKKEKLFKF